MTIVVQHFSALNIRKKKFFSKCKTNSYCSDGKFHSRTSTIDGKILYKNKTGTHKTLLHAL